MICSLVLKLQIFVATAAVISSVTPLLQRLITPCHIQEDYASLQEPQVS
jgi:hypothetical protein